MNVPFAAAKNSVFKTVCSCIDMFNLFLWQLITNSFRWEVDARQACLLLSPRRGSISQRSDDQGGSHGGLRSLPPPQWLGNHCFSYGNKFDSRWKLNIIFLKKQVRRKSTSHLRLFMTCKKPVLFDLFPKMDNVKIQRHLECFRTR